MRATYVVNSANGLSLTPSCALLRSVHARARGCMQPPPQPACTGLTLAQSVIIGGSAASSTPTVQIGQTFTYRITVSGTPGAAASTVVDALPDGIDLDGSPLPNGCSSSGSVAARDLTVTCNLAAFAAASTVTINLPVRVTPVANTGTIPTASVANTVVLNAGTPSAVCDTQSVDVVVAPVRTGIGGKLGPTVVAPAPWQA